MNILMVTQEYPPYLVGGIGTHVQELARGLVARGVTVCVVTFSTGYAHVADDNGVRVRYIPYPFSGRPNQYPERLCELDQLNRLILDCARPVLKSNKESETIVHIHDWPSFGAAEKLRSEFMVPVVITVHGLWSDLARWDNHLDKEAVASLESDACRRADRVIAVSAFIGGRIAELFNADRERLDIILNGFDIDRFCACARMASSCRLPALGGKTVVYAGRVVPQKGVLTFLRSAMRVLAQHAEVRYLIVGGSDDRGYVDLVMSLAQHHPKLKEAVDFLGSVPRNELAGIYKCAAVVVVPSLYEPFGYAALEPMALGKPVIASATGGLAEIIEDEVSGILIPLIKKQHTDTYDLDMDKLVSAQLRVLSDSQRALLLGENARLRARQEFSVEKMIMGTLSTYGKCYASRALVAAECNG
jgi:glycosyltransferase involved in cell wall biosynthesis